MKKSLVALIAALLSAPAQADLLIDNANGIQVDATGRIERFTGILIGDDGKVKSILRSDQPRPEASRRFDVNGRTLLPGLIDAHGHVMALGQAALTLDLTGTKSLNDLQQRLKAYADANPDYNWIIGRGWNQELWPDKSFPTAADLDSVVADRPVSLGRVDGHALVVNSAALKATGISAATKDPAGGKIERDLTGAPTGLLIDGAKDLVESKIPAPTPDQRYRALMEAQELLLSFGITAAADMGTSAEDWSVMEDTARHGRLNVRILAYAFGLKPLDRIARNGPINGLFKDRLSAVGVKIYADGALGSRGAWLKQPYADQHDTRGLQFLSDAELREQADEAARRGMQIAVHAIGDAANAQVISLYEGLSKKYGTDRRWRIEHFQIVSPSDIKRLASAGIIASMQPTHQTSDRLMAEKRLGPDRLGGTYAWQSTIKSGARIAFGSDFPVESPNPFPGIAAAISRQDMNGEPPGGWLPKERVSLAQALSGFTRDAAYAGFAEDRIGSLDPGKWADFVIVDRDPTTVDPQALARTEVFQTWVGGEIAWAKK